jgi:mRNA-degrading endonuclease RelE of RelBE toxin-antitoxin system
MSFKIILTEDFKREFKRLHKKHTSLPEDIANLGVILSNNPTNGTAIGQNCYKIRMPIRSKGKGKSGGARVITYVKIIDEIVYLLSIYDKGEQSSISEKEIIARLNSINKLQ